MNLLWIVGGDFNVILSDEEMIGELPVISSEVEDFVFCVHSCDLMDINFKGRPFTWWNGRANSECIIKILEKILMNQEFIGMAGHVQMEHLPRTWSDHAPYYYVVVDSIF
ncbi:hypothetical protein KY289_008463 [Solanum tuberosum]|nr:hypothetical protein KY289_008463 [Solanum tuberosum]